MIKNMYSRWASSPDNISIHEVWDLASNYHGAYFLSFLQTSSLLQTPFQAGLAPYCIEELLCFTNNYFL